MSNNEQTVLNSNIETEINMGEQVGSGVEGQGMQNAETGHPGLPAEVLAQDTTGTIPFPAEGESQQGEQNAETGEETGAEQREEEEHAELTDSDLANLPVINLDRVSGALHLRDGHKEIVYQRVINPEGGKTDFFTIHVREAGEQNWTTKNGTLSKGYTVVKSGHVISDICNRLGCEILMAKSLSYGTFSIVDVILSGVSNLSSMNCIRDLNVDTMKFVLSTQVIPGDIADASFLSIRLVNAFAGERKLSFDFGYAVQIPDGESVKMVNNVLLLLDSRHSVTHDGSAEIVMQEIMDVKTALERRILTFQRIPFTVADADTIGSALGKTKTTAFKEELAKMVPENMNLFYVSFLISSMLQGTKKVTTFEQICGMLNKIAEDYMAANPHIAESVNALMTPAAGAVSEQNPVPETNMEQGTNTENSEMPNLGSTEFPPVDDAVNSAPVGQDENPGMPNIE